MANSFVANHINVQELCRDVLHLLNVSRSPDSLVLVLAGYSGGVWKSLVLTPLLTIYGDAQVFETPVSGSFPLLGILGSKVCFFDEWRFGVDVLPWSTQCLPYDGSNVPVNRPQNVPGQCGQTKYFGSSPVFATTKLSDVQKLAAHAAVDTFTGRPGSADASMIMRRLKVYPYMTRIGKPPPGIP